MSVPFRRALAGVAVAGLAGGTAISGASPAQSLPAPADGACPDPYPVSSLVAGQPVDGLTVATGTVPDQFTGEVLGVIKDGIAPDLDMIVVRLTNPEIDRVGGIWAGMSGSPVYAADGRLVGAVSYGLAYGPSPVAGVTPAADMKALLDESPALSARAARRLALPARLQQRVVASGAATAAEADAGLQRLPIPLGVSGAYNAARLAKIAKHLSFGDVKVYRAGSVPSAPVAPADSDIFAGSNIAASLAYGDFSAVATGTTTMVCGEKVVAFGHPLAFTGDSTATMHGASSIYIQEDPLGAPFKVANASGPVGTIDQDRKAGIKGEIGPIPASTLVHTTVTVGSRTRTGDTHVSVPAFLPDATAFGFLGNMDRVFDQTSKGSSLVTFTITGHTAANKPFSVARTNRFTDPGDITFTSMFEAADDVAALAFNEFTDVTIDNVDVNATLSPTPRSYHVGRVQVKVKGVWRTLWPKSVVKAKAGRWRTFRTTLVAAKGAFPNKVVQTWVHVPDTTMPGSGGMLTVGQSASGDTGGFGDGFKGDGGFPTGDEGPKTFDELLASLSTAPRNDELTTQLDLFDPLSESVSSVVSRKVVDDVLTNARTWDVRVVK